MATFVVNEGTDDEQTVEAHDWLILNDRYFVFLNETQQLKLFTIEATRVHTIRREPEN